MHATSPPRSSSAQATSVRSVSSSHSAFCAAMSCRRAVSFSRRVTPLSKAHTGAVDRSGLSVQTPAAGSKPPSSRMCLSASAFSSVRCSRVLTVRPSKPRAPLSGSCSARNWDSVGTPGWPARISCMPLPSSCRSACKKYRPSVHRYAPSRSTASVPAEPVNPDRNSRALKCAPTYSEP